MNAPKDSSLAYPSLADLATLAREAKLDEVILGLAKRVDAAEQVDHERAVRAFDHLTDKPKSSWAEANNAGEALSPEKPESPENLVTSILSFARTQHLMKLIEDAKKKQNVGMN